MYSTTTSKTDINCCYEIPLNFITKRINYRKRKRDLKGFSLCTFTFIFFLKNLKYIYFPAFCLRFGQRSNSYKPSLLCIQFNLHLSGSARNTVIVECRFLRRKTTVNHVRHQIFTLKTALNYHIYALFSKNVILYMNLTVNNYHLLHLLGSNV